MVSEEIFLFLLRCDGAHEIIEEELSEENRNLFRELKEKGIIRPADFMEFLSPEQEYKVYPAKYKRQAHWSITGECNLKCRHCFMSAPHAKHGAPTHDEIINIADQHKAMIISRAFTGDMYPVSWTHIYELG